jgi:hypothetical protein
MATFLPKLGLVCKHNQPEIPNLHGAFQELHAQNDEKPTRYPFCLIGSV